MKKRKGKQRHKRDREDMIEDIEEMGERSKKRDSQWKPKWNPETRKLMTALLIAGLLGMILCNLLTILYRRKAARQYAYAVAAVVGSAKEAFPSVPEEEIIRVLNSGDHLEDGKKILERYGVLWEENSVGFVKWQNDAIQLQLQLTVLLFLLSLVFAGLILGHLGRRQGKIDRLGRYMNELCRGNYTLDLVDNAESELSGLKNELYKLTVFFREQAFQAEAGKRALSDTVADISHQLKTPLTSATVLIDNLLDNPDMDPVTRHRFLAETGAQLTGVSWLVSTLLKLSRLDAGVVELDRKEVPLLGLAKEVIQKLELSAELREVSLESKIPGDICVMGDFLWLSEALLNIVKNAVEHTGPGGKVILNAQDNEVYTQVTVEDNGEGIDPEDQKHLFERFYRGKRAGGESVGIGLALSKEIIERHEGYITIESGIGQGTTFLIKFLKCH